MVGRLCAFSWIAILLFVTLTSPSLGADVDLTCRGAFEPKFGTATTLNFDVSLFYKDRSATIYFRTSNPMLPIHGFRLKFDYLDRTQIILESLRRSSDHPKLPFLKGAISRTDGFLGLAVNGKDLVFGRCYPLAPQF